MALPIFSSTRGWMFRVACVGLVIFGGVVGVWAQQPNAQVKLMLERLPLEKQQKLKNFAEAIEAYVNDYDWTGEGSDEDIPVIGKSFPEDLQSQIGLGRIVIRKNRSCRLWVSPGKVCKILPKRIRIEIQHTRLTEQKVATPHGDDHSVLRKPVSVTEGSDSRSILRIGGFHHSRRK